MLNLLKFRARAKYADGCNTELTGVQAYRLYADAMQKIVEREGGKFLFAADTRYLLIGQVEKLWDMAALVEYLSAPAFVRIVTSAEVAQIGIHRAAGLEGQLLICLSLRWPGQVMTA
jgi:uncharacterized protein (DUF1330 family)